LKILLTILTIVFGFTIVACGESGSNLIGTWERHGNSWIFLEDQTGMYEPCTIYDDCDTTDFEWSTHGETLTIESPSGRIEELKYEINGNTLALIDEDGYEIIYTRVTLGNGSDSDLVGNWEMELRYCRDVWVFSNDQTGRLEFCNDHGKYSTDTAPSEFEWSTHGGTLTIEYTWGEIEEFEFKIDGSSLTLIDENERESIYTRRR